MLRNRKTVLGMGLVLLPLVIDSIVHSETQKGTRVPAGTAAPKVSSQSDAALHSTGLSTDVALKASWQPLSLLLRGVQSATGVPLSRADSVPDAPVFAASSGVGTDTLLRQVRRLLSDSEWEYQWANQARGGGVYAYRLWRQPVSAAQRHAFAAQQARTRLSQLLAALHGGPAAWQAMSQNDPDTAMSLQQKLFQGQMLFLGTLSDDQLNGALAGQPLTLSAASLSPQQKDYMRQSLGGSQSATETDADGHARVLFDRHTLDAARVVIKAVPASADPGSLSLSMVVYTGQGSDFGIGGDVLYPASYPELAPQRTAAATGKIADAGQGARSVTINAAQKPVNSEPVLAAYLRDFARQTHLTVLGYWPAADKAPQPRLANSIVDRPAAEALDTLARSYNCHWLQEGRVIRFRSNRSAPSSVPERTP